MKSILKKTIILLVILFSTTIFLPAFNYDASAAEMGTCEKSFLGLTPWYCHVTENPKNEDELTANAKQIAVNAADIITTLAAYLSVGFIIYGGYLYIFSSGDPGKALAGRKTILRAFVGLAIVLLANVIVSSISIALMGESGKLEGVNCASESCIDANVLVKNVINWIIGVSGLVAGIFVVIGSVGYITSSGDPSKLQKAKTTIAYALVGLIIVGLSLAINSFVFDMINAAGTEGKDIKEPITNLLNSIIGLLGIVSVIFVIKGAIGYMTSTGDPGKTKKAKDTILYACLGLILVALSFAVVNFAISKIS